MRPRLRECCRQGQAEVVSNSINKIHQTWGMISVKGKVTRGTWVKESKNFADVVYGWSLLASGKMAIYPTTESSGGGGWLLHFRQEKVGLIRSNPSPFRKGLAKRWSPGCVNAASKARQQ